MPAKLSKLLMIGAAVALAFQIVGAQSSNSGAGAPNVRATATAEPSVAKVVKAAADALGMPRWSQVGGGHLPEVNGINTIAFWASGTPYSDYHVSLAYNPPGMRVEMAEGSNTPSK